MDITLKIQYYLKEKVIIGDVKYVKKENIGKINQNSSRCGST